MSGRQQQDRKRRVNTGGTYVTHGNGVRPQMENSPGGDMPSIVHEGQHVVCASILPSFAGACPPGEPMPFPKRRQARSTRSPSDARPKALVLSSR